VYSSEKLEDRCLGSFFGEYKRGVKPESIATYHV